MSTATCCATLDELGFIEDLQSTHRLYTLPDLRASVGTRRKREFTPDEQKDCNYWLKRNRNNEAAKRSRQRKRFEGYLLEARAVELQRENEKLKVALSAVNHHNTGLNHHRDLALKYPLGMPNDGCPHVPTTVIPLQYQCMHGLFHCQVSGSCGSICAQTSHCNSVYDLASYSEPENTINTSKMQHISLLDSYPISRYSQGSNMCTSGVYLRNRGFTYEHETSQMLLEPPQYSNPVPNLSRNNHCFSSRTSSSESTLNCSRHPGQIGATHEVPIQTKVSEETCRPNTPPVLLPHKLRYKFNNARFVTKYLS